MSSSNCQATTAKVIATLTGWACFCIGIAAVSSTEWIKYQFLGQPWAHQGLFRLCTILSDCYPTDDSSWRMSTRAFMILMVIVLFAACCMNLFSLWKPDKKLKLITASLFIVAGIFGIVGVSIFTNNWKNYFNAGSYLHGYALAWLSSILSVVVGIVAFLATVILS